MSKIFTRQELQELFEIIRKGKEKIILKSVCQTNQKDYSEYYIAATNELASAYNKSKC